MTTNKIILNELRNFVKQIIEENYRKEILDIIDRAYKYKVQVLDLKYPYKFLDKKIKKYTQENYENDLKKLRNFDINLLWDKSFWKIGVSSSITAIATEPYTKLKKLLINENKDTWYDIDSKLTLLKSYIHILNNSDGDYELPIKYFIILYNFLIIERGFFDDVVAHGKQINKFLNLEKLNNADEVYQKFLELYNTNHQVRNNVETFDNIESIREYLSKRPEVYNKLIKK